MQFQSFIVSEYHLKHILNYIIHFFKLIIVFPTYFRLKLRWDVLIILSE